jgi:hypothetical protein
MNTANHHQYFVLKLLAVALVIFGLRLWLIYHFGSSVPFWDQWGAQGEGFFLPWLDNTLTLNSLVEPHNEHRILLTRLLTLLLFFLNESQWFPLLEIVVNALLSTLTAILTFLILKQILGESLQNRILLMILLLWVVPYGWENMLAGFHSCWYLMILLTLIGLWGALLHDNWTWQWWSGIVSAFLAFFNLASGFFVLLVFIVIKLYLIMVDTKNRRSHLPTLLVSIPLAIICVLLIEVPPHHPGLTASNFSEFVQDLGNTLAWPWIHYPWLSLVIYLPFFALIFRLLWLRYLPSPAEIFTLALGGWVILQAASMAYARSRSGVAPGVRYLDVLSWGIIVNFLAFYCLHQTEYGFYNRIKPYFNQFAKLWLMLVVFGIGVLFVKYSWPSLQYQNFVHEKQLNNTREFIRTGQLSVLKNKPYLHVPYPHAEYLAKLLSNPQMRNILPHSLAIPPMLQSQHQKPAVFVANGFYPTTEPYQNETALGSYNHLGNPAVGRFESTPIQLKHSYMEIPVAGYLGKEGLSLQLVLEGQEMPILITPPELPREQWVSYYVRTPNKPFKLVAIDNNPNFWFAFAMPRSLGALSFMTLKLLEYGWVVLLIGISLLFAIFASPRLINNSD